MADEDPLDSVVAGYDLLAARWDEWADAVQPPVRDRYVDWLETQLRQGSQVLELGCGTGYPVADRLAGRNAYLGVDASPVMVATAARNVPAGRFMVADMRRLEFAAETFDAVVAFCSIIHVPRADQPALFRAIRRWLRPGGYIVACLTSSDLPAGRDDNWLDAGPMFWSGYDADTNRRMLNEAGLQLLDADVVVHRESDGDVAFQWIKAQAPLYGS